MSIACAQPLVAERPELSPMLTNIDIAGVLDRLQAHALAEPPGCMTDNQVRAAVALLKTALPDLYCIELTGEGLQIVLSAAHWQVDT